MLGQPISMLLPQVVGFRLDGELPRGRDRDRPRAHGDRDAARERRRRQVRRVLRPRPADTSARRPRDDRQHVARVRLDLRDLPGRRRDAALPRVHRPADRDDRARRRLHPRAGPVPRRRTPRTPTFSDTLELDLADGRADDRRAEAAAGPDRLAQREGGLLRDPRPSSATEAADAARERRQLRRGRASSPSRPPTRRRPTDHDGEAGKPRQRWRRPATAEARDAAATPSTVRLGDGEEFELDHGRVVIAAITSCTNTSNPSVMIGAGLLARKARRAGLTAQALGEDLAGAGLDGGHRLPRARRPRPIPRRARLQPRRLRLHDLHRQLGAAAGGDLRGRRRPRPRRLLGALRQPQLRGPDQPGREGQLPRLAAARASPTRSPGAWTSTSRPSRSAAIPTASRSTFATSGPRRRRSATPSPTRSAPEMFTRSYAERLRRRRELARDRRPGGGSLHLAGLDLRAPAAVLRGHGCRAGRP